jgi:hypothetical protein
MAMDLAFVTLLLFYATLFVALITFFVAVGGIWSARELQASRKLEWAPYLTFQPNPGDEGQGGFIFYTAKVTNIGRGPAINCVVARRMTPDLWQASAMFDLGGGEGHVTQARQQTDPMPEFLAQGGNARTVLFCQDQFGSWRMFDPPKPPKVSRRSWFRRQGWAKWYRSQIQAVG